MATNPNRPAYLDTIESTWGQSVADHVVRRYATMAARDADLGSHPVADLAGQIVTVNPANGDSQQWVHDGARWRAAPLMKGGLTSATTNSGSVCTILFTTPFPAGYQLFGLVQVHQNAQAFFTDGVSASLNGFTTTVLGQNGAGIGGGFPLTFNWLMAGFPQGSPPSGREATDEEAAAIAAEIAAMSEGVGA